MEKFHSAFNCFVLTIALSLIATSSTAGQSEPLVIGIYTGTFDPPHPGHEAAIREGLRRLKPDILYVVPNFYTPHKPGASPYWLRKEMAIADFSSFPKVVVAPRFLERAFEKGGPELVLTTLRRTFGGAKIYRIIGDDSYETLQDDLKTSPEIDGFIVTRRANGLSSTKYRTAIANGQVYPPLQAGVLKLILAHRPYKSNGICQRLVAPAPPVPAGAAI